MSGWNGRTAADLTAGQNKPDVTEIDLLYRWMPLEEVSRLIRENIIQDAETVAAWTLYSAWKARHTHIPATTNASSS